MEHKPLKRHPALIPLSRDHHAGLLLCWKIRTGFKKSVAEDRMAAYTVYFFEHQLAPHFSLEEKEIFSCLPEEDVLRKEAENQHIQLYELTARLRQASEDKAMLLHTFEQTLDKHIRFEERQLFMHIQGALNEEQLTALGSRVEAAHTEVPEQWDDRFWE